jgi:hypothetical protein
LNAVVCDQCVEPLTDGFMFRTVRLLPNDPPRHVCCLEMVAPIRLEQQEPSDNFSASMDEQVPKYHNDLE